MKTVKFYLFIISALALLASACWDGNIGDLATAELRYHYVAVGEGGAIYASKNGSTWYVQTSGVSVDLYGVAWLNNRYVAVGKSSTILTSPDGITWTTVNTGSYTLRSVTCGGGYYVAVGEQSGSDSTIYYSSDAKTWTSLLQAGPSLYSVIYADGMYVAAGPYDSTNSLNMMYTSNPASWTGCSQGSGAVDIYSMIYTGSACIACGRTTVDGTTILSWQPKDPGTWDDLNPDPYITEYIMGIAKGNGIYVAAGYNSSNYTAFSISLDAWDSWTLYANYYSYMVYGITYGDGRFVAVGQNGVVFVSTDGANWSLWNAGSTTLRSVTYRP